MRKRIIVTVIKEPFVQFALAAAVVFGLHALTANRPGETIELTRTEVQEALEMQQQLIGRALTDEERQDLIDNLLTQEILLREAIARDFHLHDSKTRKRLVSQMHFVMAEDAPAPTAADLAALKAQSPERYMLPRSVTFDHVFFAADEAAAEALKQQIDAGRPVPEHAGGIFWLGNRLEEYSLPQILIILGHGFAQSLRQMEPGVWSGPVRSGRGWHLVRLGAFNPPRPLPEQEIDRRLREDWKEAYSARAFDTQLAEMKERYRIVVDRIGSTQSANSEQSTEVVGLVAD